MPWFVVAEYPEGREDEPIWTVSQYPGQSGWNTDCSFPGYGMTKAAAQFLVDAANEKEARDGQPFPITVGEW